MGAEYSIIEKSKKSVPIELLVLFRNLSLQNIQECLYSINDEYPGVENVNYEDFDIIYCSLLPDTQVLFDLIKFDENGSVMASIQESVVIFTLFCNETTEQKIKFLFQISDIDGSGELDISEMSQLIKRACQAVMNLTCEQQIPDKQIFQIAQSCFDEVDVDLSGSLSYHEFTKWALEQDHMSQFLQVYALCSTLVNINNYQTRIMSLCQIYEGQLFQVFDQIRDQNKGVLINQKGLEHFPLKQIERIICDKYDLQNSETVWNIIMKGLQIKYQEQNIKFVFEQDFKYSFKAYCLFKAMDFNRQNIVLDADYKYMFQAQKGYNYVDHDLCLAAIRKLDKEDKGYFNLEQWMEYRVANLSALVIQEEIFDRKFQSIKFSQQVNEDIFLTAVNDCFEEFKLFCETHHKKIFNFELETNDFLRELRKGLAALEVKPTFIVMRELFDKLFYSDIALLETYDKQMEFK